MVGGGESESFGAKLRLLLIVRNLGLLRFSESEGGTSWASCEDLLELGFGLEKREADVGELTVVGVVCSGRKKMRLASETRQTTTETTYRNGSS
jgi:hypothetical protein